MNTEWFVEFCRIEVKLTFVLFTLCAGVFKKSKIVSDNY